MHPAVPQEKVSRKSFLGYAIAAVGAFIGSTLGVSTAIFAASPLLTERRRASVTLGSADGFKVGAPKAVEFSLSRKDGWVVEESAKAVWVVRLAENDFAVLAGRCTHLGCAFNWRESEQAFICPCHNGRFSPKGEVLGGPPPRPLDRLESRIEGGKLVIDYVEFRLGVPEKVEV